MIKCSVCESKTSSFFLSFDTAWRLKPSMAVCRLCDSCGPLELGRMHKEKLRIYHISKEDYLAALAMAEL